MVHGHIKLMILTFSYWINYRPAAWTEFAFMKIKIQRKSKAAFWVCAFMKSVHLDDLEILPLNA